MKTLIFAFSILISTAAMSAQIKNCRVENKEIKNIVVLNDINVNAISNILNSSDSASDKSSAIKGVLLTEATSIGLGNSFCELASKSYKIKGNAKDKCYKTLKSSDLIHEILDVETEKMTSLNCKIGITAKLLMEFDL